MEERFVRNVRRSKLEIYIDILYNIKKGVNKPTQIMYASNLSWNQFKRILESMLASGLISEVDTSVDKAPNRLKDRRTKKIYLLAEKGERVIQHVARERDMRRFLSSMY